MTKQNPWKKEGKNKLRLENPKNPRINVFIEGHGDIKSNLNIRYLHLPHISAEDIEFYALELNWIYNIHGESNFRLDGTKGNHVKYFNARDLLEKVIKGIRRVPHRSVRATFTGAKIFLR